MPYNKVVNLSHRERHLLALRFAAPALLASAGMIGFALPFGPDFKPANTNAVVGWLLVVPIVFGLFYSFRWVFPDKKLSLEPGQTVVLRPSYAWRAAAGTAIGIFLGALVLARSMSIDPFGRGSKSEIFNRLVEGGAGAGLAIGSLVFLYARVLYLRVRSTKCSKEDLKSSISAITALVFMQWVLGVLEEARKHSVLWSVGSVTWSVLTIVLVFATAVIVYLGFIPKSAHPGMFRSKQTSEEPTAKG